MYSNPAALINQGVSDAARDSVRGSFSRAQAMANEFNAKMDTVYDNLRVTADGAVDLSSIRIEGAATEAQKMETIIEWHSKLHGANAAMNELSALTARNENIEAIRTIGEMARGGPSLSDTFDRGIRQKGSSLSSFRASLQASRNLGVQVPDIHATLFKTTDGFPPDVRRTQHVQIDYGYSPFNLEVLDAMGAPIPTTQNAVEYMAETITAAAAAETAEGAASPEVDISYAKETVQVETIRAILPVTEEQLADEPTIRNLLDTRLIAVARDRVNQQLVIGDGSTPNMQGVKGARVAGNDITAAYASSEVTNPILAALQAIRMVRTTGRTPATHILMSGDYTTRVLTMRTTDGEYLMGAPSEVMTPALFGVPIVESDDLDDASAQNNVMAIAGDFVRQASFYLRRDAMVEAGWNDNDFSNYQISLRVSLRAAAVWYRSASFIGVKRG